MREAHILKDPSRDTMQHRGRTVVWLKAEALWERLTLLGRSQNWLARETGISPGYLSMLVNNRRTPSGRVRRRMQQVLGVEDFHALFAVQRPNGDS